MAQLVETLYLPKLVEPKFDFLLLLFPETQLWLQVDRRPIRYTFKEQKDFLSCFRYIIVKSFLHFFFHLIIMIIIILVIIIQSIIYLFKRKRPKKVGREQNLKFHSDPRSNFEKGAFDSSLRLDHLVRLPTNFSILREIQEFSV